MDENDSDGGDCIPRKPLPPATLYYLESYFADCLAPANRIVTRVPFAALRERIVPILGIAIVVDDPYSKLVSRYLPGSS